MKLSEYIKDLQKQYKTEEARKVAIKLLCSSQAIKKGSVKNG